MTTVTHVHGIAGAAQATGAAIVIDTFRAFTTAAVLFDRGIDRLILADSVEEAEALARANDALLCGEVGGIRPEGFDLGNSPFEAMTRPDLEGAVVVQRTSSGTRSVIAALDNGASPVFAASAVVAGVTARAVAGAGHVTIVSAGQNGVDPAMEDDLTAEHIAAAIEGLPVPADTGQRIATCERAGVLSSSSWAHPDDVTIAAEVDRYAVAMRAIRVRDAVALTPHVRCDHPDARD